MCGTPTSTGFDDHVRYLGPFTVAYELRGHAPKGLPHHPAGGAGEDFRSRIQAALARLLSDCHVGHLLVAGPEQIMLEALAESEVSIPISVWIGSDGAAVDVARSIGDNIPGTLDVDVVRAPRLPTPRGNCPAMVVLGLWVSALSYLAPSIHPLLRYFDGTVLGELALIDPTDGDPCAVPAGWCAVWTRRFTRVYRAADPEGQGTP